MKDRPLVGRQEDVSVYLDGEKVDTDWEIPAYRLTGNFEGNGLNMYGERNPNAQSVCPNFITDFDRWFNFKRLQHFEKAPDLELYREALKKNDPKGILVSEYDT